MDRDIDSFFEQIVERYLKIMEKKAYRMLKDYQKAEDAVQMTFAAMCKNIHKINPDPEDKSTLSYMFTILEHKCMNIIRDNAKYTFMDDEDYRKDIVFSQNPQEEVEAYVYAEEFVRVIKTLPERYSRVLTLRFVHQNTMGEIAQILEISQENVRQRLHRGRLMLKQKMRIE